ncbi:hypothetical protein U1Q18_030666 [Sarracenia purpurea var. burkii]
MVSERRELVNGATNRTKRPYIPSGMVTQGLPILVPYEYGKDGAGNLCPAWRNDLSQWASVTPMKVVQGLPIFEPLCGIVMVFWKLKSGLDLRNHGWGLGTLRSKHVLISLHARLHIGHCKRRSLMVHITDGIQFVNGVANSEVVDRVIVSHGNANALCNVDPPSNEGCTVSDAIGKGTNRIDILIVDVDSSDSSSGLTCPASDFVEESFLCTVKNSLSEQGLFVINLVSRSSSIREMVVSSMNMVFGNLFHLQLEEDVNEVLFALNTDAPIREDCFQEASCQLEKILKLEHPERSQSIINATKKIKGLK